MFPVFPHVIETLVEVLENSKLRGNFPLQFLVLPKFHECFYNCMETRKMFSIS